MYKTICISVLAAIALTSCDGRPKSRATQEPIAATHGMQQFEPVMHERTGDAAGCFWEGFRFDDPSYVAAQDTAAMLRYFAHYAMLVAQTGDPSPMAELMRRAEASDEAFRYFMFLGEAVLHDPNSPLRNDELYIPVLETIVETDIISDIEKTAPRFDLDMAMKNRTGHPANDFLMKSVDGRRMRLYDIASEWTLLFFSNPECPMCHSIQQQLEASRIVTGAVAAGRLKVVMVYPDDDLQAWSGYAQHVPGEWIYARNADGAIRDMMIYDLKAIPSMYLLDAGKRVILKDISETSAIEYVLAGPGGDEYKQSL